MAQPDEGSGETPTVRNDVPETTVKGSSWVETCLRPKSLPLRRQGIVTLAISLSHRLLLTKEFDNDDEELEVNEELARELTLSRAVKVKEKKNSNPLSTPSSTTALDGISIGFSIDPPNQKDNDAEQDAEKERKRRASCVGYRRFLWR